MEKTEKITKNIQELYQSGQIGKHDRYGSGDKIVNKNVNLSKNHCIPSMIYYKCHKYQSCG